jgi:hypothetical protein
MSVLRSNFEAKRLSDAHLGKEVHKMLLCTPNLYHPKPTPPTPTENTITDPIALDDTDDDSS